ncbi:G-type lectin S-receptor-like serine/threonine-protein kinase SD2-5 [Rhododendron vialii]|uniref:G-type lectin S-receptor-like serine/threonine-protein kinase SD2-5 n=1 Tax=Rhododendron vialii TaxID=182163 RepID=UPI00266031CE|nr:G-type lectin S-receptor-like serine/threonine-protein kinase SD2-5 [Rhododendron vialii]
METNGFFNCIIKSLCFCALLGLDLSSATSPYIGKIYPGFEGSQMNWVDHNGLFLLSNNSIFALRFYNGLDVASFVLVVIHMGSSKIVWTANRGLLVRNTDKFVFDKNGNVYLENATSVVWSTDTKGKGVTSMELLDTGNLVLVGDNKKILWQSFSHPTDTLLSGQEFVEGMRLKSFPSQHNLNHYLEIKSNDVILYAGYRTPQVYWSMANDNGTAIKEANGTIFSASIVANSWNFYDRNKTLVWQFRFSPFNDVNATWAAVLGTEGSVSFINLERGAMPGPPPLKIPKNSCGTPEPCNPFVVCSFDIRCQCPSALRSHPNCMPQLDISCNSSQSVVEMLYIGEKLHYFALGFVVPVLKTHLNGCKEACIRNCSCRVLFFENTSGNCFLFDQIGSLQRADSGSSGFTAYIKVQIGNGTKGKKHVASIVIISVLTVIAIVVLLYIGFRLVLRKDKLPEPSQETSEEDNFLDNVSGMPVRFSYNDLCSATKDFSEKLGQGGFGSVYQGLLRDGTKVAVKKLEGIGQGKKEFRAEVSIIGNIHHVHLVKLKGFCAEGSHRLLVYEYMGKGSLDKWIFTKIRDGNILDWEKRFNIALGTAKGLAYLHEECDVKIVHCDIKPENVLLDDNFLAKVSDFGLAKLMGREQSHVYTVVRGTRGYLAPEWITNHAISEKSDVYSFGMVLLEIIGGRKNYNPGEISEKAHFPSYALKMMEEGKLEDIIDPNLDIDKNDERIIAAMKVALWCIQDDMHMRPPMSKVVQMLEGLCAVPEPPALVQMSSRLYSSFFKSSSEEGTSSGLSVMDSVALLPDVELSGPR